MDKIEELAIKWGPEFDDTGYAFRKQLMAFGRECAAEALRGREDEVARLTERVKHLESLHDDECYGGEDKRRLTAERDEWKRVNGELLDAIKYGQSLLKAKDGKLEYIRSAYCDDLDTAKEFADKALALTDGGKPREHCAVCGMATHRAVEHACPPPLAADDIAGKSSHKTTTLCDRPKQLSCQEPAPSPKDRGAKP